MGHPVQQRKGWFEAHKEEYLTTFQRPMKALADEVYGAFTDRHPDLDLICKVSRIYRDARAALRPRPLQGPSVAEPDPPPRGGCAEPVFWFELGPEATPTAWLLAGSGRHHGQVPRPHGPEPSHGKLARRFQKQDVFVLEGRTTSAPRPPLPLLTPGTAKELRPLPRRPPREPLWSHDLVDLLLEGYEFLLPYYEYMLSLSGDPDPRAQ